MRKRIGSFQLYDRAKPPVRDVWAIDGFHEQVGEMVTAHGTAVMASIANVNAGVRRFARGEELSDESFRREGKVWAFRSGRVRWYAAFSTTLPKVLVLSHVKLKDQQKLDAADEARALACAANFDTARRELSNE